MIKRNHADRNVLNDKYAFKYRTKQYTEEGGDVRVENRRMDLELSHDENGRLTSNNKKYHQYKEEREMKSKKIEVRNQGKNVIPLSEIRAEENYTMPMRKENSLLKREYKYDANDKVQEKEVVARPIVLPQQTQRNVSKMHHNMSFNEGNEPQALRRRVESLSIQKEIKPNERINTRVFVPSLEGHAPLTERKYERRSYQQLDNHSIKLARDYDRIDQAFDRPRNIPLFPQQLPSPPIHNPAPFSLSQEEMSLKLKQISSFNEQINERIKSIIGGFMTLKGKL